MKTRIFLFLTAAAISIAFASCSSKSTETAELENTCAYPLEMENFTYSDSSNYANIDVKVVMPVAKDSVSQVIRDTLMDITVNAIRSFKGMQQEETKPLIAKYDGEEKDLKSVFNHYGKAVSKMLNSQSKEEYDERVQAWTEDTTITSAQREEFISETTPWEYSMDITKTFEDSTYVVFSDTEYTFLGGAHGGIFGFGYATFRFSDGSRVRKFLKDGVIKAMQPLLRKGLKEFFCESEGSTNMSDEQLMENLMLAEESHGLIPLPVWQPCPDREGKGLLFVYQQYEIACYAAGMPAFVLTWDELQPFLDDSILADLKR